ncbi:hypothetical protein L1987_14247 [Smallanthus sonchifolius]|uniref:Uncharacterized protein n=1 Tax=Smallanthus sonchifolius TaxID=185202 RepID=A0ACB9J3A2_9ASTR|nr:hypothetical protein L1987_14247 [Smallanthus sonchifolius]
MDTRVLLENNGDGLFPNSGIGFLWCSRDDNLSQSGSFFASVGQMGRGSFGSVNPNLPNSTETNDNEGVKLLCLSKVVSTLESSFMVVEVPKVEENGVILKKKRWVEIEDQDWESIIKKTEGWTGLFRGNLVNVIRVAPSKAIELFAYDTIKKSLTPKPGEKSKPRIPESLIAAYKNILKKDEIGNIATLLIGSAAGTISSSATFPLEVARKHMQAGAVNGRVYDNMLHALLSILEKEGAGGLYRGLGPSCIKIVPAAGISFMCYEACKKILVEKEDDEP